MATKISSTLMIYNRTDLVKSWRGGGQHIGGHVNVLWNTNRKIDLFECVTCTIIRIPLCQSPRTKKKYFELKDEDRSNIRNNRTKSMCFTLAVITGEHQRLENKERKEQNTSGRKADLIIKSSKISCSFFFFRRELL